MGNKKQATRITNIEDYLKLFPDDKETKQENMRYIALKEALDIRKFEIELNWKRTAFFWAFITVVYAALFTVICKYLECSSKFSFFIPIISTLSGLGFFFSVAWHQVNKGSKFWQENWEKHVSLLERDLIGPLYDVYLNPKATGSRWKPTKAFDFSVSKVNMCGSTLVSIISFIGCVYSSLWFFEYSNHDYFSFIPSTIIAVLTIIIYFTHQGNKNIEINESPSNEKNELDMIYIL